MNPRLEVFLCGPQQTAEAADEQSAPVAFRSAIDESPSRLSAELFNDCIARCRSELVCFASPAVARQAEVLQEATAAFQQSAVEAVLLPLKRPYSLPAAWRKYPPPLAVLVERPEANNVVIFRRSSLEAADESSLCEPPIWRWLVRMVFEGRRVIPAGPVSGLEQGSAIALEEDELPPLVCRSPQQRWLLSYLTDSGVDQLVPKAVQRADAVAVKAGLFQLHGFLDESHRLSQSIQGEGRHRAGDYWHAIMHRREPDYSNSCYWFRRVGRHPIFARLARVADGILSECGASEAAQWRQRLHVPDDWDPFAFVELCRCCEKETDSALRRAAQRIAYAEMLLLMEQSYRDASVG